MAVCLADARCVAGVGRNLLQAVTTITTAARLKADVASIVNVDSLVFGEYFCEECEISIKYCLLIAAAGFYGNRACAEQAWNSYSGTFSEGKHGAVCTSKNRLLIKEMRLVCNGVLASTAQISVLMIMSIRSPGDLHVECVFYSMRPHEWCHYAGMIRFLHSAPRADKPSFTLKTSGRFLFCSTLSPPHPTLQQISDESGFSHTTLTGSP